MEKDRILETVIFDLRDGVRREEFLAAVDEVTRWARKQPGFVSRELLEATDGRWVDTVWWQSLDQALAAAAGIADSGSCRDMIAMIDMDSATMLHAAPVFGSASGR